MTLDPRTVEPVDEMPEGADGDMLKPPEGANAILEQRRQAAAGSYYKKIVEHDPLTLLEPLLRSRGYRVRWGDGRLEAEFQMQPNTPWKYNVLALGLDCYLWHSVIFTIVSHKTQRPFVPSKCLSCFKTVVRLNTCKKLFAWDKVQESLPFPCKAGIELRNYTSGYASGYHYAQGLDEGLEQYKYVRHLVNEHPDLGPETPVLLKRGCTEYERELGPSEKWSFTEDQLSVERMIENILAHVRNIQPMPWSQVFHVHRKWIERACQLGDMTYLEFTGGMPLSAQYTTYHHLADPGAVPKDLGGGWWEYRGEKYRKPSLPVEAIRNAMLREVDKNLPHPHQRLK